MISPAAHSSLPPSRSHSRSAPAGATRAAPKASTPPRPRRLPPRRPRAAPTPTTTDTEPVAAATSDTATSTAQRPAGGPGGGAFGSRTHGHHVRTSRTPTRQTRRCSTSWLPEDSGDTTPLVIYIHGGAFKSGDKGMVGGKVQPLLDAGFAGRQPQLPTLG